LTVEGSRNLCEVAVNYPLPLAKLIIRTGLARFLPCVQRKLDGGTDYLRYFSDRLLAAPWHELEQVAAALASVAPEVIDLGLGSPQFDLVPSGSTKLPADRRGWPPAGGLPELRAAVAHQIQSDTGLAFDPAAEIHITPGALGAVQTVLDAVVNRGDRVVLPDPVSPLYPLAVRARGARVVWLPTRVEDGRTRLRLDHLARSLRGARLFVLNSPANPTGGILARDDLEQIAWWAQRHDVLLLSDEVFARFHYEVAPVSVATMALARPRTLVVGSVSKSHALAAARVGWLAGHRHLLRPCIAAAAVRTPFVPTLSQHVALAALRTARQAFAPILADFESRRRYCVERLRAQHLDPVWPAGGFFVWLPVGHLDDSGRALAEGLLRDQRVRVVPGDLFGPGGAGYVRLSYAADDGRLQEGLNRLGEQVRALQGRRPALGRRAA
jgi:aspartate/methionine/tyrosine aminotransferase